MFAEISDEGMIFVLLFFIASMACFLWSLQHYAEPDEKAEEERSDEPAPRPWAISLGQAVRKGTAFITGLFRKK